MYDSLSECLTPDVAAKIAAYRTDDDLQGHWDLLAEKNSEGTITPVEKKELDAMVRAGSIISILQAIARRVI